MTKILNFLEQLGLLIIAPFELIGKFFYRKSSKKTYHKHQFSSTNYLPSKIYHLRSNNDPARILLGRKTFKDLAIRILLIVVIFGSLFYLLFARQKSAIAGWWDDTWQYRKAITIASGSSATSDYQVKINNYNTSTDISAGKMQTDCGDIRFTSSAGVELPYWVVEDTCNTSTTDIWVKVDSIPASGGTTIYMYYGNPSAKDSSNIKNTFIKGDDFEDNSLDTSIWSTSTPVGTITETGGTLQFYIGSGESGDWWTGSTENAPIAYTGIASGDWIAVTKLNSFSPSSAHGGIMLYDDRNNAYLWGRYHNAAGPVDNFRVEKIISDTGTNGVSALASTTTPMYLGIRKVGTTKYYTYSTTGEETFTDQYNTTELTGNNVGMFLKEWGSAANTAPFEYFYIRKYLSTEPAATAGSEEQGTSPIAYYSFDEGAGTTVHNQMEKNGENGLISWWKMDEGAANTCTGGANDSCDTMGINDGAWNGNATTTTTAKIGNAVTFDGTGDYVSITDNATVDITGSITLSAWVKTPASLVNLATIIGKRDVSVTEANYALRTGNTTLNDELQFYFYANSSWQVYTTTAANLATSTWYHLAVTYDGTTVTIYKNGVAEAGSCTTGTCNMAMVADTNNLAIGRSGDRDAEYWSGQIDEVKLFNRSLSASEVEAVYQSMHGHMIKMSTTASWVDGARQNPNQKPLGKALDFDGSDDYIEVVDDANLDFGSGQDFTISVWVNTSQQGQATYWPPIVSKQQVTAPRQGYEIILHNADAGDQRWYGEIWTGGTQYSALGTSDIDDGLWHHLVFQRQGTTLRTYEDGKLANTSSGSGRDGDLTNSYNLRMARMGETGQFPYAGKLDEAKIYRSALTADQIKKEYNRGAANVLGAGESAGRGAPPKAFWKLDEGSAYSAFDSSGNNNTGVMTNMDASADWVAGKVGKGLDFDGSNDYVEIADSSSLDITGSITISAWIYPTALNTYNSVIAKRDASSTVVNYGVTVNANGTVNFFFVNSATWHVWTTTAAVIQTNNWYYYTATYDGATPKIYINGVLQAATCTGGTCNVALVANNNKVAIGRPGETASSYWTGKIDHVKIYDYVRSPQQIHYDMATGSPIAYYSFDEGTSTTVHNQQEKNGENGLVSWYKFDDASSGTTPAPQDTMEINDGTWNDNASYSSTAKVGNAATFDGAGDYINVVDSTSLGITNDLTVSTWIYPNATVGDDATYRWLEKGDSYFLLEGTIDCNDGNGTAAGIIFLVKQSNVNKCVKTTTTLPASTWGHVSGTYDGTNLKIYLNGSLKSTNSLTGSIDDDNLDLRIGSDDSGFYFAGKMDEVKIYNRSLSASEIEADYQSMHGHMINMDASTVWEEGARQNPNQKPLGKSVHFDGNDDKIVVADIPGLTSSPVHSISGWVYADDAPGYRDWWLQLDDSAVNGAIHWIYQSNGTTQLGIYGDSNGQCTPSVPVGQWTHIVTTYDGSSLDCYINGKKTDNDKTASLTFSGTVPLDIGGTHGSGTTYDGKIDELKIYNYVLTDNEIKTEYNRGAALVLGAGKSESDPTDNLVAWWKFDEGGNTSASAFDSSGKNHNLNIYNYPPERVQGKYGKAFNNTTSPDSYGYYYPDDDDFDNTNVLTVSTWFYYNRDSYVTPYQRILGKFDYTGVGVDSSWTMYFGSNARVGFYLSDGTEQKQVWTQGEFTLKTWHHVVGVFDSSNNDLDIYLDGVWQNNTWVNATTMPNSNFCLTIGYTGNNTGTNCTSNVENQLDDAYLDNIKIWRAALTDKEIAWEYNQGAPQYHWSFNQSDGVIANNEKGKSVTTDGLVGFWTMDSTTVNDFSGNGNNLTNSGSPTSATGKKGNAVDYLASSSQYSYCNDGVNCTDDELDYQGNGITLSTWVKADTTTGNYNYIIDKEYYTSSTENGGYFLVNNIVGSGGFMVCFRNSSGTSNSACINSLVTPSTTAWQHVVGTYDGATVKIYVDGVLKNQASYSGGIKNVTQSFKLGARWDAGGEFWDGKIDHVKVFQRALSESEIKTEYQYDEKYGYLTNMETPTDWVDGAWPNPNRPKLGKALDFDGSNEYVMVPDDPNLEFCYNAIECGLIDLSLSAWVKRDTATTDDVIVAKRNSTSVGDAGYLLQLNSTDEVYFEVSDGSQEYSLQSSLTLTDTLWHHVLIVFDESSAANSTIYIDGKQDPSITKTGTIGNIDDFRNAVNMAIGAESDAGSPFDGQIDEVKIYNYALTANQAKVDYNNSSAVRF